LIKRLSFSLILFATSVSTAMAQAPQPCTSTERESLVPITLQEVATGFRLPVHLTHAADGSSRLFVVEQPGTIRIIRKGKVLAQPFLDIRARVVAGGERGLLSIAFHPQYKKNGYAYVNYTSSEGGLHTVIARYQRNGFDRLDPGSEKVLLKIDQPYSNHNGGQLAFGPDGFLYIGMGDGGAANDPRNNGQNPATLLGAMLRIDVDKPAPPLAYSIPDDNPFVGKTGYRAEIWAMGLRNPWRFSFDAGTGWLYAADVGQDEVEEVNVIRRGRNYGWRIMEGDICTPDINRRCNKSGFELPIATYRHPEGFSVTGGFVYRGRQMPGLCGAYLYTDYVTPIIRALRYNGTQVTSQREIYSGDALTISSFGEDEQYELYVLDHRAGRVLKIIQTTN
jgi:glucose/arabinose dehydrogenase